MDYKAWLGIVISAVIVLFMIRLVDYSQLVLSLQSAEYPLLLLAVLSLLLTLVIKSWRWQYLVEAIKPISVTSLLSATSIGAMTDMLLPARTGDIVRAYVLGQKERISKMASLGTLAVEKILDVLIVLAMAIPLLVFVSLPGETSPLVARIETGVYLVAVLCVAVVVAVLFFRTRADRLGRFVSTRLTFLPERWRQGLTALLNDFAVGLQTLKKGRHVVLVLLLSVLLWSVFAFSNYLILHAFSLQLPFYAAFLFLIFQVLGVTLPSSPGFIGTYHAAVVAGFALFGVSQELALSVAITMHAAFFFPFILVGLLFLWRENLSFRTLQSVKAPGTSTIPVSEES